MIRINQIKIPIFETADQKSGRVSEEAQRRLLLRKAAKLLKIREDGIRKLRILRRSVDAREKKNILFVYLIDVKLHDSISGPSRETEADFVRRLGNRNVTVETEVPLSIPEPDKKQDGKLDKNPKGKLGKDAEGGAEKPEEALRPLVVGAGPCGLFAAHTLCRMGFRPILIERGERMEKRLQQTERFFETGKLSPDSNVQFGEGGAGTFSDGKLNTSVKGQGSFIRYVLERFHEFGADGDILYEQKPHIGTDRLSEVIVNLREAILKMGGDVLFDTKLCGLETEETQCGGRTKDTTGKTSGAAENGAAEKKCLTGVLLRVPSDHEERKQFEAVFGKKVSAHELVCIPCRTLVFAPGHSARDTLEELYQAGLSMQQKPFAMGVRVQHPQKKIDEALYGSERLSDKERLLGAASYKLTHTCRNGRSIYSFCMCPGGYVVNSSSEPGRLCINGMSCHDRDSGTANAALIVNIGTEDFPSEHPLSGISLQRELEEKAYSLCGGAIPCETFGDFKSGKQDAFSAPDFEPQFKGFYALADIRSALPKFMQEALLEGMEAFDRSIHGFGSDDAFFSLAEARTSSPVRIPRGEDFMANIEGIYPAGEGAGYAGGITSAAADGIRAALAVQKNSIR